MMTSQKQRKNRAAAIPSDVMDCSGTIIGENSKTEFRLRLLHQSNFAVAGNLVRHYYFDKYISKGYHSRQIGNPTIESDTGSSPV